MEPFSLIGDGLSAVGGVLSPLAALLSMFVSWHEARPVMAEMLDAYIECPQKDDACRARIKPHIETLEKNAPSDVRYYIEDLFAQTSNGERAHVRRRMLIERKV